MGSLQKILPEVVSEAVEEAFLVKLQAKIFAGANNLVMPLHTVALYAECILRIDMSAIIPKRNIMYRVAD